MGNRSGCDDLSYFDCRSRPRCSWSDEAGNGSQRKGGKGNRGGGALERELVAVDGGIDGGLFEIGNAFSLKGWYLVMLGAALLFTIFALGRYLNGTSKHYQPLH